jgi:glycosyltransferase involved in cell wall biosynthesis
MSIPGASFTHFISRMFWVNPRNGMVAGRHWSSVTPAMPEGDLRSGMRVLQVTPMYYPELHFGGPPQKIHDLSRGLRSRGHEVRVATLHSARPGANASTVVDGVPVRYLSWVGRGSRQVPLGAWRIAEMARQSDVIHGYGLYNLLSPAAARIAGWTGRPFVLEPLGMGVVRARNRMAKGMYHRVFSRWMYRAAGRVIATSPAEYEDLFPMVPPGKLVLRRNGIDLSPFRDMPPREEFRNRLGIPNDERILLYLGRISPIKNLEDLVHAFKEAALDRARLFLVGPMGESGYAARLRLLVSDLALGDRVALTGPMYGREKLAALSSADLFVLPSIAESYGNAAAEAVAAGLPVLLTQTCGIAAQIHDRAGVAVPLRRDALVEGMRRMLDDPEHRGRMTANRAQVVAEISWDEPVRQMEELYVGLVQGGKRHNEAVG